MLMSSIGDKRLTKLPQWSDQSIHVELTQICYKSLCTTYYLMATYYKSLC